MDHPPLANTKVLVAMRLIIGVNGLSPYPIINPINPAMTRVCNFVFADDLRALLVGLVVRGVQRRAHGVRGDGGTVRSSVAGSTRQVTDRMQNSLQVRNDSLTEGPPASTQAGTGRSAWSITYPTEVLELCCARIGAGLLFSWVPSSSPGLRLLLVWSLKSTSSSVEPTWAARFPRFETIL